MEEEKRYKCHDCFIILKKSDLEDGKCPECKTKPKDMCPRDRVCDCADDITGGSNVCPICGEFTCPCGSHSVMLISRITGYIQEVGGWNSGKVAEFVDRHRTSIE